MREATEAYFRDHGEYAQPLEISHWQQLHQLVQFLCVIKTASLKLEADECVTGSRAVRVFRMLRAHLREEGREEVKGRGAGIVPLARAMLWKLETEVDKPNWLFGMAFLAFMDPAGEWLSLGNGC